MPPTNGPDLLSLKSRRIGRQLGRERAALDLRDNAVTTADALWVPPNATPAFAEGLRQGYLEGISGRPQPLEP